MINLKTISSITQGCFGNVELVEDDDGNRFARKTFSREVRIQSYIVDPNIVPIVGSDLATPPLPI